MSRAGRALRIWLAIAIVGSLALPFTGLVSELGYDFALVVSLFLGLAVPHITVQHVADARRHAHPRRNPVALVLEHHAWSVAFALVLASIPLSVLLVRGLFVPACDVSTGLLWFVLLPCVSVLYLSAVGVFFGLAMRGTGAGLAAAYGFLLLTWMVAIRHVIVDPPTFFFHGIAGYVPGPIYDEEVSVTNALLWARAGSLAWAVLFLCAAAALAEPRKQRLDFLRVAEIEGSLQSVAPRIGFLLAAVALVVLGARREEIGTSPTARSIERELGGLAESQHFTIVFDEALSRADVELLVEDHEFRLAQLLAFLEWDSLPDARRVRSIVYPTADLKKRLMGAKHTSFADPYDRTMHLNAAAFPHPVLKHELAHVLSASFAGPLRFNPHIGIHEGFAVAADWEEERLTPDQWAAAMRKAGLLPTVSQASSLAFWTLPSARAYLAMGSFSRFLIDRFGVGAYQRFFRTNDAEEAFGRSFSVLEGDWLAHLDTVRVTEVDRSFAETRLGRRAIFERRCPREVAERAREGWDALGTGRGGAALRAFERAAVFAPEDPDVELGRLYALLRLDRGEEARALGGDLLEREKLSPRLRESVHDVLGNEAWRRGDLDDARRHFAAILETRATEHLVRAAILKVATLEQPEFRRVLAEEASPIETGISLAPLAERGPGEGYASYLLGRRLFDGGTWPEAASWLERAIADSVVSLHAEIDLEARWLLGQALYRSRSWDDAAAVFESISLRARTEAEALRAASWIERVGWRRTWDESAVRVVRKDAR